MHAATSTELLAEIRTLTPKALVSFSRGKDSLASYLRMRDVFDEVVPYHYYVVPGLEFVEESLAYYEQKIGRRILRFPSPGLARLVNNLVYQPPDRIERIRWMDMYEFSHDQMQEAACESAGLDYKTAYNGVGVRSKDPAMRAMVIRKHGAVNHTRRTFYPIFDYDKEQVLAEIKRAGWKLPIDYRYFSASFDGLYIKFMYPLKLYFPKDYQRILDWFPLLELEVLRYEAAVKRGEQPPYVRPV